MNTGSCILSNCVFLQIRVQERDCWIIRPPYFWLFEEPPYSFSEWLHQFAFPPAVQEGGKNPFLTLLHTRAFFWLVAAWLQSPRPVTEPPFLSVPPLRFVRGHRSFSSGPALTQSDLIVTWLHPTYDTGGKWEKDPFPGKVTFPSPQIRIWTYHVEETQFNPLCPLFSDFHCVAKLAATLWKTFLFHFLFYLFGPHWVFFALWGFL